MAPITNRIYKVKPRKEKLTTWKIVPTYNDNGISSCIFLLFKMS